MTVKTKNTFSVLGLFSIEIIGKDLIFIGPQGSLYMSNVYFDKSCYFRMIDVVDRKSNLSFYKNRLETSAVYVRYYQTIYPDVVMNRDDYAQFCEFLEKFNEKNNF